jgi:hypothetical protein
LLLAGKYAGAATAARARRKVNETNDFWTMRNGYALCTDDGLTSIARRLDALDGPGVDRLRDLIRIGIHSGVQVTDAEDGQLVSQAFCSALPVSYSHIPSERWRFFATLVLEGAYEATLWAAVTNAHHSGSNMLFSPGLAAERLATSHNGFTTPCDGR